LHRNWLTAAAVLLVFFEVATVLILRAHYTMDVFTGILAALWIAHLTECISPRLDQFALTKNRVFLAPNRPWQGQTEMRQDTAAISIGNKTVPAILLVPSPRQRTTKQTVIKDGFQNLEMI